MKAYLLALLHLDTSGNLVFHHIGVYSEDDPEKVLPNSVWATLGSAEATSFELAKAQLLQHALGARGWLRPFLEE